jgi:hypothetical protein
VTVLTALAIRTTASDVLDAPDDDAHPLELARRLPGDRAALGQGLSCRHGPDRALDDREHGLRALAVRLSAIRTPTRAAVSATTQIRSTACASGLITRSLCHRASSSQPIASGSARRH